MTVPANAYTTYAAIGNREDLADVIYNVSPTDTPFMANIGKGKATAKLHEWQTDTLAAANPVPALEGDDFIADAVQPTVRIGNRTTILKKSLAVTNTQQAVNPAGMKRAYTYELIKKTKELRRDQETLLTGNTAPVVGSSSVATSLRPLVGWYATNITDATSGFTAGTATAAATDGGTTAALTEALVKSNLQSIFTNGGSVDFIFVGAKNKQTFSGFAGPSGTFRTNVADSEKLNTAVSIYVSDFGDHKIVPNRFQRTRDVHLIDSEYWSIAYLRDMTTIDIGVQGDSQKGFVVTEFTLEARNEASSGIIADCA